MTTAYLSFTSTFNSYVKGKISLDLLKEGELMFNWSRDYIFTEDPNMIPMDAANALGYNVWRENFRQDYPRELIPNAEKYFEFKKVVEKLDARGLVRWRIPNYSALIQSLLSEGYEVYYQGHLQTN